MVQLAVLILATMAGSSVHAFKYRFYADGNCNHNAAPGRTYPRNDGEPFTGSAGNCYSAPTGVDWQRLEIDTTFAGTGNSVITFCNVGCQGSGSSLQKNTNCYIPFPGCAIGSFKVV